MPQGDVKVFYDDPGLERLDTIVIETGESDGRPWARLGETIFYPEGGGQPADRGTIGDVLVVDVQSRGSEVLHFLERPILLGPVTIVLDAARRFDHRQQHTAQHLLTAHLADRYLRPTTSFHLGAEFCSIDVAGPPLPDALPRQVESEVNEHIRRNAAVRTRWVEVPDLAALEVRTRGLPEGHVGPVRLVEIEGIDLNTCGGTHVSQLSEIQVLHVVDAERARGGTRVRFLAGGRVTEALGALERLEAALKERVGTGREEIPQVLDLWRSERRRLEKRLETLQSALADREAAELSAEAGSTLSRIVPGASPEQLRALASGVLKRRPEAIVVLLGGSRESGDACFLVQAGPEGPEDVGAIGEALREAIGAKGGGRGRLYQGREGTRSDDPSFLRRVSTVG